MDLAFTPSVFRYVRILFQLWCYPAPPHPPPPFPDCPLALLRLSTGFFHLCLPLCLLDVCPATNNDQSSWVGTSYHHKSPVRFVRARECVDDIRGTAGSCFIRVRGIKKGGECRLFRDPGSISGQDFFCCCSCSLQSQKNILKISMIIGHDWH